MFSISSCGKVQIEVIDVDTEALLRVNSIEEENRALFDPTKSLSSATIPYTYISSNSISIDNFGSSVSYISADSGISLQILDAKASIAGKGGLDRITGFRIGFDKNHALSGTVDTDRIQGFEMDTSDLRNVLTYLFLQHKTIFPYFMDILYRTMSGYVGIRSDYRVRDLDFLRNFKINSEFERLRSPMVREFCQKYPKLRENIPTWMVQPYDFNEFCRQQFKTRSATLANKIREKMVVDLPQGPIINNDCLVRLPLVFRVLGFDYFYQFLENYAPVISGVYDIRNTAAVENAIDFDHLIQSVSTVFGKEKLKNMLLLEPLSQSFAELNDGIGMLESYDSVDKVPERLRPAFPKGIDTNFNFKTVKEWHDKIADQYNVIEAEKDAKPIDVVPEILALQEYQDIDDVDSVSKKPELEIVITTSTKDLVIWGKKLGICIGSYGDKARSGRSILGAIREKGQISYCFEIEASQVLAAKEPDPYEVLAEANLSDLKYRAYPQTLPVLGAGTPKLIQLRGLRNQDAPDHIKNFLGRSFTWWSARFANHIYDRYHKGQKHVFDQNIYVDNNNLNRLNVGDIVQNHGLVFQADNDIADEIRYQLPRNGVVSANLMGAAAE